MFPGRVKPGSTGRKDSKVLLLTFYSFARLAVSKVKYFLLWCETLCVCSRKHVAMFPSSIQCRACISLLCDVITGIDRQFERLSSFILSWVL